MPNPGYKVHTQRITSAVALTPPSPGMTLVSIRCYGGTTPGTLGINYNGQAIAHFPVGSNATRGFEQYEVNWRIAGTNIPAASITLNGGIVAVEFDYATMPNPAGRPIESFRAIRQARTDGGAVTATITTAFDMAPGSVEKAVVLISASAGRVQPPATGPYQFQQEANILSENSYIPRPWPYIEPANGITDTVITDGASTIQVVLYY